MSRHHAEPRPLPPALAKAEREYNRLRAMFWANTPNEMRCEVVKIEEREDGRSVYAFPLADGGWSMIDYRKVDQAIVKLAEGANDEEIAATLADIKAAWKGLTVAERMKALANLFGEISYQHCESAEAEWIEDQYR